MTFLAFTFWEVSFEWSSQTDLVLFSNTNHSEILSDDDLLEIIGNASTPGKVLPHLGKMFASIATCNSVPCEEEGVLTKFDAMLSKDGERVVLDQPITVTNKMNVKDWLKQLESGMHTTLAKLLNEAVEEVQSSATSATTPEGKTEFVNWATRYPAQVMILGMCQMNFLLWNNLLPLTLYLTYLLFVNSITRSLEYGYGFCSAC